MADSREKDLHKHVRIAPEQWERLERAAQGTPHSPNQILVELAMAALDRREWPATEVEMRVARTALFTAQATALDPFAAGREKEVQEIRDFISSIVSDPDTGSRTRHSPFGRLDPMNNRIDSQLRTTSLLSSDSHSTPILAVLSGIPR